MKEKVCKQCNCKYKTYNSMQSYCSRPCYDKYRRGKPHNWGYKISRSLKGKSKSAEHVRKVSEALRKYKERKCKQCKNRFYPKTGTQKFCSHKCFTDNSRRQRTRSCKMCGKNFQYWEGELGRKFCGMRCFYDDSSKSRKGKNNPNYKDGKASWEKYRKPGRSHFTVKHFRACKKYREAFVDEHGYPFCEVCYRSDRMTHVHHIYYASLYPRHEYLHDFRNLIMVCVKCHMDFHGGKLKETHKRLEKERGLKELFQS